MSTMIVELYDGRFDRVDAEVARLQIGLARVEAELGMVKWIVSGVGFGVLLLVLRSFWRGG